MSDDPRPEPDDAIDLADLALLTDTTPARVQALIDARVLTRRPDGRLDRGDVHRVRLINAFVEAGVPLEALVEATAQGRIDFESYPKLHVDPGHPSTISYGEFRARAGPNGERLGALFTAFGLPEPDPSTHLSIEDEHLLSAWAERIDGLADTDLALRLLRLESESARRMAVAAMDVYVEAASRLGRDPVQVPTDAYADLVLGWGGVARSLPALAGWLAGRHLQGAIDAFSVETTEQILAAHGYVDSRERALPAVAFVDLTGFTRATQAGGDELAADYSLRLGDLASSLVARVDGRLVKLLGDGALLTFPDVRSALDATIALLDAMPRAGLPGGHAGIHHGPIIEREGDVFGRTVNLAARLSDVAPDGEIFVTDEVAGAVAGDGWTFEPAGEADLLGIGPTRLFRVIRG